MKKVYIVLLLLLYSIFIGFDEPHAALRAAGSTGGGTPGGSSGQIQYNNAGAFGGYSNFIWAPSPGTLTSTTTGPAAIQHWTNSNGGVDQKDWDFFFTTSGNNDILQGRLLNSAGSLTDNWLQVSRNGVDNAVCLLGAIASPYQVCDLKLSVLGGTQFLDMNNNVLTFALNNNDSANIGYINNNIGVNAFLQNTLNAGNNTTTHSAKMLLEIVPQSATANTASCNTVDGVLLTLPYTCLGATFHFELAVSAAKNNFGSLAHVIQSTNNFGTITTKFGDSFSATDVTDILAGGITAQFAAGHISYSGTAPSVTACGTSPTIDANATDVTGTVTVGTVSAASCTITFATAYTTWNHCRVTSQSAVASFAYSYTLSAITVTATSLVSDKLDYECDGA